MVRIGTAGWEIGADVRARFPAAGSRLERYAARFPCVEINSSFYRPHRPSTYARWAASVPETFRFALKVPRTITHERRLVGAEDALDAFLAETSALGDRRGVLLVQLPPSLAFDADVVAAFLEAVRARYAAPLACEPRNATWFDGNADALLARYDVARVGADPAVAAHAAEPGGWDGFAYRRLHGSPRTYYSEYDDAALRAVAARLRASRCPSWCIFDNTASGAATANALDLASLVR